MGLLERGQAALISRQKKAGATAATLLYQRKAGGAAIDLTGLMWRGDTRVFRNPAGPDSPTVVYAERDYLVAVADLAVGAVPFEPVRGDRISEVVGDVTTVYEVLPAFGDEEARYSDQGRTLWRIHAKEVAP